MKLSNEMARNWFGLKLELRRRWWEETDYGKKEPSEELKQAIREAIDAKEHGRG